MVAISVGAIECKTDLDSAIPKPLVVLERALAAEANIDVLIAPEWFIVGDGTALTQGHRDEKIEELKTLSARYPDVMLIPGSIGYRDGARRFHNEVNVFLDGELVYTQTKARYSTPEINRYVARVHEGKEHPILDTMVGRMGIEICCDHTFERVKSTGLEVDVQIVLGSGIRRVGVPSLYHVSVSPRGIVVHNDGFVDGCDSWVRRRLDDGRFQGVDPVKGASIKDLDAYLKVYRHF